MESNSRSPSRSRRTPLEDSELDTRAPRQLEERSENGYRLQHRPRPKSVYDMSEAAPDLRRTASYVAGRDNPARGSFNPRASRRDGRGTQPEDGYGRESQEFLRRVGASDFTQASQFWSEDRQRLRDMEARLGGVDQMVASVRLFYSSFGVRDLAEAASLWNDERKRLADAQDQFHRLQNEVLANVDRFQPTFDTTLVDKFRMLQGAIGRLTNKELTKAVKLDTWASWEESVLWPDSVNETAAKSGLAKGEEKLLVRQAVWKFLVEALFDRARPFASFGGASGELASRFAFDKLFPDHELNEDAAKWRSLTVKQLSGRPDDEQGSKQLQKQLATEFGIHVFENMTSVSREDMEQSTDFARLVASEKLDDVLNQAIDFSRLLMSERASFALRAPPLTDMKFKKEEIDETTTIVGGESNMVYNDEEEDKAGEIKLCGSPMLVKYGNAGGQDLHQETLLLKAFVVLV